MLLYEKHLETHFVAHSFDVYRKVNMERERKKTGKTHRLEHTPHTVHIKKKLPLRLVFICSKLEFLRGLKQFLHIWKEFTLCYIETFTIIKRLRRKVGRDTKTRLQRQASIKCQEAVGVRKISVWH